MSINDQHRKQLQELMSQPQWAGYEAIFDEFMRVNFIQASIKRNSEFETIWYAAEQEGAKRMLQQFHDSLEIQAKQV